MVIFTTYTYVRKLHVPYRQVVHKLYKILQKISDALSNYEVVHKSEVESTRFCNNLYRGKG